MRHHLDEFSVTDVRHTLEQAWRIVCHRRWFFIFPFCIVSIIALLCSLMVPRQYTSRTIIKQERDPVFANMMGKSWTHPYAEIRKRMADDLQNEEVIAAILEEMSLPEGSERFENGGFTPQSQTARRALARDISKSLSLERLTSSSERDVIAITLTMSDPEHVADILRAIRDRYMTSTRKKAVELLHDVMQFFRAESERCRSELKTLEQRLAEYELRYPGIDPDLPDTTRTEQAALVVERVELERRLDELQASRQRLEEKLAGIVSTGDDDGATENGIEAFEPNPQHAKLTQEISRLLREIVDKKTLRGMTEQHPVIRQLRAMLAMRQEELAHTPQERSVTSNTAGGTGARPGRLSAASRLRLEVTDADANIADTESQLAAIQDQLSRIRRSRALAVAPRQEYLKLKQEAGRVRTELGSWQQNIGPIEHIFTVEDRDRTIHFATVEDVTPVTKPSSPDAAIVTLICFAIGAAVGALFVLLGELIDRSYRTVKHLKASLGLPVIESIDEIVTEGVRRKRLVRSLVLMPTAALACIMAMAVAGSMAYLSIEKPSKYEALKSVPLRAVRVLSAED